MMRGPRNSCADVAREEKRAYWGSVEDCLVQFHGIPKPSSHARTNAFRKRIARTPPGINGDLIYHEEPFYVACDIAGMHCIEDQERLLSRFSEAYATIKDERGW
jgi:hypothetical protein